MYLTIPEITDAEDLQSLSAEPDGVTFNVVIAAGTTAVRLMQAFDRGEHLPLVVLATGTQMLALDDVYVTGVQVSGGDDAPSALASVTFLARAVRLA